MTFDIITNRGSCSWYEFTEEISKLAGMTTPVAPMTSGQFPQKAGRPHYSVLDNAHLELLGTDDMRPWPGSVKKLLGSQRSHKVTEIRTQSMTKARCPK